MSISSRLSGFHALNREERLARIVTATELSEDMVAGFASASSALGETADHLSENVIGTMNIPLGIATNMVVDGKDVLVPMATEESSVIAAVCNGARQCRGAGGVTTSTTGPLMIAQIQVLGLSNPFAARASLLERKTEIEQLCNDTDPLLVRFGGGFRDIDIRILDTDPPMMIVHLIVDTRDAMGANAVNTMAEAISPKVEHWTGGTVRLRILSNLADRRLVRARARFPVEEIGGSDVRDGMIEAAIFAQADPYRAATHNKGIMNGISAVMLATGNDTRAVEAGAHAYAARSGRYAALSRWERTAGGALEGVLEMPLAAGIIGGATKVHPTAQLSLEVMKIVTAERLAAIACSVGLVQNFSALKALATEGIQRGHMALHAKNVAISAGAVGEEISAIAAKLIEAGPVREDSAREMLKSLREP